MTSRPLPSADKLLDHQGWVRALALQLVREPSEADDLVQDTWLAALEHPPGAGRELAPWLARVLRNFARRRFRGEARRRRREAEAPAPSPLPAPAELLERVSFQRMLVERVLALDEPYRTTVLLHHFEELPAREIAARQGIQAATVRQRLKRARERLREALDEARGGREAWSTAFLVWTRPPAFQAARPIPVVAVKGARAMSRAWIPVTVVTSLAAGITWLGWLRVHGAAGAAELPLAEPPIGKRGLREHERASAGLAATSNDPTARVPAEASPSHRSAPLVQASATLAVHVRRASDGLAVAGEWILIDRDAEPFAEETRAVTDAQGDARLELPAGEIGVGLQHRGDDLDWITLAPEEVRELELELPAGYTVLGVVLDPDGIPIPGASIWVGEPWSRVRGHVLALSDEAGRFRLSDLQPDGMHWIGARAPGWAPSPVSYLDANPGDEVSLRILLRDAGGSVRGRVVDAHGVPVPRAQVLVGFESAAWASSAGGAPPERLTAEEDGSFVAAGVPSGRVPLLARAPGFGPAELEVAVVAGAESSVMVTLELEARLRGRVSDPSGAPVGGAEIEVLGAWPFALARTRSDPEGGYELGGLGAGRLAIVARGGGEGARLELTARAGDALAWDPVLRPLPTITGRVLDEGGRPVAGRELALWEDGPIQRGRRYAQTDPDGHFSFGEARERDHVLVVEQAGGTLPLRVERGVRPALEPRELRVDEADGSLGVLAGQVLGPEGEPLPAVTLAYQHAELDLDGTLVTASDGSFELRLPPGHVWIRTQTPLVLELGVWTLAAGQSLDAGTHTLPHPAALAGELLGVPESAQDSLSLNWSRAGLALGGGTLEAAGYRSPPLAPGVCTLWVQGDGIESQELELEAKEGVELRRNLALRPAAMRRIELETAPDDPRPARLRAEARDDQGRIRWTVERSFAPAGPLAFTLSAVPGAYELAVRVDTGLGARARLTLAGDEPDPLRLRLSEP